MSFNFVLFEKRLLETMVFCHHILGEKAEHSNLWDAISDKAEILSRTELSNVWTQEYDWSHIAKKVFDTRSKYLETLGLFGEPPIDKDGRLIIYFPDISLYDGTAEFVSKDYFNFIDTPPYSTWLYYVDKTDQTLRHIIAWIPGECIKLATFGVEVICCGATIFLDDEDFNPPYKADLQALVKRLGK